MALAIYTNTVDKYATCKQDKNKGEISNIDAVKKQGGDKSADAKCQAQVIKAK